MPDSDLCPGCPASVTKTEPFPTPGQHGALTWGLGVSHDDFDAQGPPRWRALDGDAIDPLRERAGKCPPPKEQPPWKLSGTRDRKGDESLESERR